MIRAGQRVTWEEPDTGRHLTGMVDSFEDGGGLVCIIADSGVVLLVEPDRLEVL